MVVYWIHTNKLIHLWCMVNISFNYSRRIKIQAHQQNKRSPGQLLQILCGFYNLTEPQLIFNYFKNLIGREDTFTITKLKFATISKPEKKLKQKFQCEEWKNNNNNNIFCLFNFYFWNNFFFYNPKTPCGHVFLGCSVIILGAVLNKK